MTEFYDNGTVSVTNGSTHVEAADDAVWIAANVKAGDTMNVAGALYVIGSEPAFDEDTEVYSLEMAIQYIGSTDSGLAYSIAKTSAEWGTNRTLSLQTAELIQGYAVGAITETQLNDAVDAAQAAQAAAETALDHFGDILLTPKAADPTTDDDGDALADGMIYLNTSSGLLRIRAAGAWTNFNAGVQGVQGVGAGLQFALAASTVDADPAGPGNARINNTDRTAATKLWLDNTDINNATQTGSIDTWDDSTSSTKGTLYIWNRANRAQFLVYSVTGAIVDKTGYREVPLSYVGGSGTIPAATLCEFIFLPTGGKGDTGAAGATAGISLVFSATTTDGDPAGPGGVRADNATFGSITSLFVDNADANSVAITAWLDSLDDVSNANARGYLRLQKPIDPAVFMEFAVTGAVTDGGGYRKVPVSPIAGSLPANGTALAAVFAPAGLDGSVGADGGDPGILLNFDTSTTDGNPTGGGIRANNGTLTSATMFFVSKTNRAGNSIATFLATLDDSSNPTSKGTLTLTRPSDGAQIVFKVTAITDATGYVKVTVASGSGVAGFSNNDHVSLQFATAGDQGSSGAGSGDFNGPASATDSHLVAFDLGTGKLGKDSGKAIADLALVANNGSDFSDKQAVFDNVSLKGAGIASAATLNLDTATGSLVHITGTVATTAITLTSGRRRRLIADAAWPITAGASLVINNGGSSYTCTAGDQIDVYADGTVIRLGIVPVSGASPAALPASYLDTDGTLVSNSDTKVASQKATKTYVDQVIAAQDAMVFKGVIDCSANPNYPAADRGHTYRVSVTGKIGGASGTIVEVGDILICLTDSTSSGNQATVGSAWSIIQTNIDGAVTGPASAVSHNLAGFNGTSGKVTEDSGVASSTDGTFASNSDAKLPTEKAVKTYVAANGFPVASQRNAVLSAIAASRGSAERLPLVDGFAEGFGGSDGINTGASSGYVADPTNGRVINSGTPLADVDSVGPVGIVTNSTGWTNNTLRQRAEGAVVLQSGTKFRILFKGGGSGATFTAVYAGHGGTAGSFTGNQVQVLFSGSATLTLGVNATLWSDWMTYTVTAGNPFVVAAQCTVNGTTLRLTSAGSNYNFYFKSASTDAASTTATGYTTSASTCLLFDEIQVEQPAVIDNIVLVENTHSLVDYNPSTIKVAAVLEAVDAATLNTDVTIEVSRTGAAWAAASLTQLHTIGTKVYCESAAISVSGQASNDDIAFRYKTFNNKRVYLHGVKLEALA